MNTSNLTLVKLRINWARITRAIGLPHFPHTNNTQLAAAVAVGK